MPIFHHQIQQKHKPRFRLIWLVHIVATIVGLFQLQDIEFARLFRNRLQTVDSKVRQGIFFSVLRGKSGSLKTTAVEIAVSGFSTT